MTSAATILARMSAIASFWTHWRDALHAPQPVQQRMSFSRREMVSTVWPAPAAPLANCAQSSSELPPLRGVEERIRTCLLIWRASFFF